jgi:hypothetical protein
MGGQSVGDLADEPYGKVLGQPVNATMLHVK